MQRSLRRWAWIALALALSIALVLLEPWSSPQPSELANQQSSNEAKQADTIPGAAPESSQAAELAEREAQAQERQRESAEPSATELRAAGAFEIRGRLIFPKDVAVPIDARVYAAPRDRRNPMLTGGRLAEAIAANEPRALRVEKDGRFRLWLPGPEPLEQSWTIIAGAIGWVGSVNFPDPRPNAPLPGDEFAIRMQPVFGATVEVFLADGRRPSLFPELARDSGGPGLYMHRGWGVYGPARADSFSTQLSVPAGLPPLVGGQDPSIGFRREELAIQTGDLANWKAGELFHSYALHLPGYERIETKLRFAHLSSAEVPRHRIELKPVAETGQIELVFDRAAWWNDVLRPHRAERLKLRARQYDSLEQSDPDAKGAPAEYETWDLVLSGVPEGQRLLLDGMPAGRYQIEIESAFSGVRLPMTPHELVVPANGVAQVRVDCGELGAVSLELAEGSEGEWSSGRLEFLALDTDEMRGFRPKGWPAFLGPLPQGEAVILLRSLDRKSPPQVVDRLNHSDEYSIVEGMTTTYVVQGAR